MNSLITISPQNKEWDRLTHKGVTVDFEEGLHGIAIFDISSRNKRSGEAREALRFLKNKFKRIHVEGVIDHSPEANQFWQKMLHEQVVGSVTRLDGKPLIVTTTPLNTTNFESVATLTSFRHSSIVDNQNNPLLFYHGTNEFFTEFDPSTSFRGVGFQFTTELKTAETYGNRVICAHLNIERPYVVDVTALAAYEDAQKTEDELSGGDYYPDTAVDWFHKYGRSEIEQAMATGKWDGYIIQENGENAIIGALQANQIQIQDIVPSKTPQTFTKVKIRFKL